MEAEVREYEKVAADKGLYPYRCRVGEREALYASGEIEPLFEQLMKARLAEWVALADERLAGTGVQCYVMGGNDDPPAVLEALDAGQIVHNPEGAIIQLDESCEMLSRGLQSRGRMYPSCTCNKPTAPATTIGPLPEHITNEEWSERKIFCKPFNRGC